MKCSHFPHKIFACTRANYTHIASRENTKAHTIHRAAEIAPPPSTPGPHIMHVLVCPVGTLGGGRWHKCAQHAAHSTQSPIEWWMSVTHAAKYIMCICAGVFVCATKCILCKLGQCVICRSLPTPTPKHSQAPSLKRDAYTTIA